MAAKQYRVIDFVMNDSMHQVNPYIRDLGAFPFSQASQDRFFEQFFSESFMFDGNVNFMYIYSAKAYLPHPSYVRAWLFTQNDDELRAEWNARGGPPDHIGEILFECGGLGGKQMKPRITVTNPDGSLWWNTLP